jgi:hypothetical protein
MPTAYHRLILYRAVTQIADDFSITQSPATCPFSKHVTKFQPLQPRTHGQSPGFARLPHTAAISGQSIMRVFSFIIGVLIFFAFFASF